MSVIAVGDIPFKWGLKQCVKLFMKKIKGQFDALNFKSAPFNKKGANMKTLYLRLSEKLDPQYVIQIINTSRIQGVNLNAYVPDYVPDLPLASSKNKKIPKKLQRAYNAPQTYPLGEVIVCTHRQIMDEMQYKYTGLYKLSKGTSHKLLDAIAKTISKRLTFIVQADESLNAFALSKSYRKKHPHFGDFQMILSILHRLQDAAGEPRTQISEQELSVVCTQPNFVGNIPFAKVKKATHKYSELIITKLTEHIQSLDDEIKAETDSEEEIARKKVRAELKKISPYINTMVREIIANNSNAPGKSPYTKFRIYGEPFIPPKETMVPFLKKYNTAKMFRSDRMFNILRFYVPTTHYASLMAMDGTILGGAKLIIRPSEMVLYKVPAALVSQMKATFKDKFSSSEQQHEAEDYEKMEVAPEEEEWDESW